MSKHHGPLARPAAPHRAHWLLGMAVLTACGGKSADGGQQTDNPTIPRVDTVDASPSEVAVPIVARDATPVLDLGRGGSSKPAPDASVLAAPDASVLTVPDASVLAGVFDGSVVDNAKPIGRVFYSWTVPEQVDELVRDQVLYTRGEQEGKGRGHLFEVLDAYALNGDALAKVLTGPLMTKGRYAWTNAWSTRMGWEGEDYGDQLLKIVLRPEAYIVRVLRDKLDVFDTLGNSVPTEVALAHPERLGAIFYIRHASDNSWFCGTFGPGWNGYREFFLGNEAMIESWSVGTQEIVADLRGELAQLAALRRWSEQNPSEVAKVPTDPREFNGEALCNDSWLYRDSAFTPYFRAMSMPSLAYRPDPAHLDALIATLGAALTPTRALRVDRVSP